VTGSADEIGCRVSELAAQGITEITYQPTGPDITGDLEAFPTTARTAVSAVAQDNPGSGRQMLMRCYDKETGQSLWP
jgi:5,10-methylenetetrahydromethanopterin reductase